MESCSLQSTLPSPTCSFGEFIITFFWWQGVPPKLASAYLSSRNGRGETHCEEVTPVCKTCLGDMWVLISSKGAVLTRDFCVPLPSKLSSSLKAVQKQLLHCCHEDPNQMIRWYIYPQGVFCCLCLLSTLRGTEPPKVQVRSQESRLYWSIDRGR